MSLLKGVRVIDLTRNIAGPYCTMMLGYMGAEVIKVEEPRRGDELRSLFRYPGRGEHDEDYFYAFNRNKKSLAINLKSDEGREVLHKLAKESDVFVENLSPGAVARLGCDYETLKEINPQLIYCSISGYGKPLGEEIDPRKAAAERAYDLIVEASTGLMYGAGAEDEPPQRAAVPLGDLSASLMSAFSIVSALFSRTQTGKGTYIDISMYDSLLSLQANTAAEIFATGQSPRRWGNQVAHRVPQNIYETGPWAWST